MADVTTAAAIGKLLTPLIKDVLAGAKRFGVRGFQRWEQKTFPTRIGNRIKSIENVRTIWKPDAISLLSFFHPPKLLIGGRPTIVKKLSDVPGQNVVLEGIVGQGKSILLRSLAVQEILSNEAKRIPLFIELKDLGSKFDLNQAIFRRLESYDIDIDDETLDYLLKSGKIALLLDGFDEIEEGVVKGAYLDIEHLAIKYPEIQVVVTSRPGRDIQKSATFETIKIAPLTQIEFAPFLAKLGVSSEKSVALRAAIKDSPSKISSLITTPLMLTLVVMVYEAESQIPETLPEFFDRLFQTVFSRHDHLKAAFTRKHHSGLSEKALQELFENFCFMTIQSGYGRTLERSQFNEVYELAIDHSDNSCDCENFRLDIVKVACLMLEDGIDSTTFLHKSILEYFAAAFVRRLGEENAILFYSAVVDDGKEWEEVLRFLKSIDSFRYSRHYLIPAVKKERAEIAPSLGGEEESILEILKKIQPDLGVYFKEAGEAGGVVVGAYGRFSPRAVDNLEDLGSILISSLSEMVEGVATVHDVESYFHAHPKNAVDPHGVHIPLSILIRKFGISSIRRGMEIYDINLSRLEQEAKDVVSKEQKKSLIFGKRKRTG